MSGYLRMIGFLPILRNTQIFRGTGPLYKMGAALYLTCTHTLDTLNHLWTTYTKQNVNAVKIVIVEGVMTRKEPAHVLCRCDCKRTALS